MESKSPGSGNSRSKMFKLRCKVGQIKNRWAADGGHPGPQTQVCSVRGHVVLGKGCVCVYVCVAQSYPTLCNSMDCSSPGSSVCGILRQEYWSGLSCPPSGSSLTGGLNLQLSPALAGTFSTTSATWEVCYTSNLSEALSDMSSCC